MAVLSLNNVKKSYKLGDGTEFPVLKESMYPLKRVSLSLLSVNPVAVNLP